MIINSKTESGLAVASNAGLVIPAIDDYEGIAGAYSMHDRGLNLTPHTRLFCPDHVYSVSTCPPLGSCSTHKLFCTSSGRTYSLRLLVNHEANSVIANIISWLPISGYKSQNVSGGSIIFPPLPPIYGVAQSRYPITS